MARTFSYRRCVSCKSKYAKVSMHVYFRSLNVTPRTQSMSPGVPLCEDCAVKPTPQVKKLIHEGAGKAAGVLFPVTTLPEKKSGSGSKRLAHG